MLEHALLYDAQGQPLLSGRLNASRDWSEVNAFCHRVYMPLATRPLVAGSDPNATLRTLSIGRIVLSRFCFGVATRADEFDPSSGNIIVVNTMRGGVRHPGVAVPQSEAERAREVLVGEAPPDGPPPAPPACPACGSREVRATRFTHPIQWVGLVVLLAALVAANVFGDVPWGVVIVWLLFIAIGAGVLLPRAFVCRQCTHRWREEENREA